MIWSATDPYSVVPGGMSRLELYEGYRSLLRRLYSYRAYRRRAMDFILHRGSLVGSRVLARGDDLAVVGRIVWTCILRTSPRRAWLTLSMALETAWRRPEAIRQAGERTAAKAGRLVAYVVGPRDWSDPAARAFLEALIRS